MSVLSQEDPDSYEIVLRERRRQSDNIVLIASENHASPAVMEATGSILTDKYAEGKPGKRYYGGCQVVDDAEILARDRVLELFGADHASVQPHAGAMANMAAYASVLDPGDRVLAMDLNHGGHLTHGGSFNFSGKLYDFSSYGVNRESEQIDYEALEAKARELRPKLIVAGASAYPRQFDFPRIRAVADSVGALFMFDMAHVAGLIAGGVHDNPVPFADIVTSTTHKTLRGPRGGLILCTEALAKKVDSAVFPYVQGGPFMNVILAKAVAFHEALQPSFKEYARQVIDNAVALADCLQEHGFHLVSGGTENHLMVVSFLDRELTGRQAQEALESVGLVANKNLVPFDTRSSVHTSGLRLGTPASTTRGMRRQEMRQIGDWIVQRLQAPEDDRLAAEIRAGVEKLTERFPVPGAVQPVSV
ncbi:MAG: serine hydroxymethyltransferase [Chloroflexota bacterium]